MSFVTAYTAPVASGEITALREFVLRCARAMMPLASMRDLPMDVPPPERVEPSQCLVTALRAAESELKRLESLTPEEIRAECHAERSRDLVAATAHEAERVSETARLASMIAAVTEWDGDPHLREFMLSQLTQSLGEPSASSDLAAPPADPALWHRRRVTDSVSEVARWSRRVEEDAARVTRVNAWLSALHASLPAT